MVSTDWSSALHRQHLLSGPRTEGDPIGTGRRLQRPERVGFLRITVVIGHANRTFLFDPHPRFALLNVISPSASLFPQM